MAKQRNDGKRERKAAQQAAVERRYRRRSMIRYAIGGLLALGVAAFAYSSYATRQLLEDVTTASYPAGRHAAGVISYAESPPVGGPHNVIWQNCGIYDVPIHNEHAVHALEHGAVWITYRSDLPPDQVQRLKEIAADDYMLLSPYPGLRSPVVASAWNHQIALESATDPRLAAFVGRFKNNPDTTPEFGASCAGGTSATAASNSLSNAAGPMLR